MTCYDWSTTNVEEELVHNSRTVKNALFTAPLQTLLGTLRLQDWLRKRFFKWKLLRCDMHTMKEQRDSAEKAQQTVNRTVGIYSSRERDKRNT